MTRVLRTPRLVLRPLVSADAEALFPAMADAQAMRWWSRPPFADRGELTAYLADVGADPVRRGWAVTRRGGDDAVGFVSAGMRRPGVVEIGYLLAPATHGRGLAGEAVAAVLAQLFAEGHRRIFADIDPDNAPSIRLVERLGFTLEGRLRGEWRTHIGVRDSLIYGLLASDPAASTID